MNDYILSSHFTFNHDAPPATPSEFSPDLQQFYEASVREHAQQEDLASAEHYIALARDPHGPDTPLIGFAYFYGLTRDNTWEIFAVGVDEAWRGKGVAMQLIHSALEAAASRGAQRFTFRWADQGLRYGRRMAAGINHYLDAHLPGRWVRHLPMATWEQIPASITSAWPAAIGEHWTIPLGPEAPYPHVHFKRRHPGNDDYQVVEVDLAKLIVLHDRDSLCIENAERWSHDKRAGLQEFLSPAKPYPVEMPAIGVDDAPKPGPWARFRRQTWPVVAFINGRHRTRMLAHFGATSITVEVHVTSAQRLIELCGATRSNVQCRGKAPAPSGEAR